MRAQVTAAAGLAGSDHTGVMFAAGSGTYLGPKPKCGVCTLVCVCTHVVRS